MNFIEPAHLHGVMKGLISESESSRHILQALPDSNEADPCFPLLSPFFKESC